MKKNSRIVNIDYEKNKTPWFYFIPLLLIAGFVPLIVHGKYIDLTGTTQALYWTGQNQLLDFFSYWKSRWVIYLTATALIIYIFLLITKKLPFKKEYKYYIPLAIYAFFVILSTIFAIDVPTALNGFVDMYQGMWVLLSYVLLTFLTINFVNSERDVKLFLYAFIFLIIVEGLIGVGQYFGFDIFNTKFGNSLIIPSGIQIDGGLNFNFGKHTIYGTLFNTNYVGSFATLMLPMAVVFLISAKSIKIRIVAGIALALCLFTWIGCNSRAGYIGVIFTVLFVLFFYRSVLFKNWRLYFKLFLVCVAFLFIINILSGDKIFNQISKLNVFKEFNNIMEYKNSNYSTFEKIEIENNILTINTNFQNMYAKIEEGELAFYNKNMDVLPTVLNENGELVVDFQENSYFKITILENNSVFIIETPWEKYGKLIFYIIEGEIKALGTGNRLTYPINSNKIYTLCEYSTFASNRGYIWGCSIPLVKENLILGSGADNFIYVFPQDDFVAKLNANMAVNSVIDKPHNMYLQIAINNGLISLLMIICYIYIYIYSSLKLYKNIKFDSIIKSVGFACVISVIGYLISGIFNDGIVSVSPIFYVILGLGISVNSKLSIDIKNNK